MKHTLIATATGNDFELAPEGPTPARCIDVVDMGLIHSDLYGTSKHKVEVYWVTKHPKEDLSQLLSVRKRYTLSLHEKASLSKDLKSWRGKAFTAKESKGFDIENLIGAPCLINVVHTEKGDKVYANVDSIMPLVKGMEAPEIPEEYIRHIDRTPSRDYRSENYVDPFGTQPQQAPEPAKNGEQKEEFVSSDELPF